MKLPASARTLIETWRLGFVATVGADGAPNVSPKGTFVVLDDETIAFSEIRSPDTMRNLAHSAEVEASFVDMLSRKGVVVRGTAEVIPRGAERFDALFPHFAALWDAGLTERINAVVVIPVNVVKPFHTPAYEAGQTETELRALYKAKFAAL